MPQKKIAMMRAGIIAISQGLGGHRPGLYVVT
jgi:hypothetical protein